MAVALTPFSGFCGFRQPSEIAAFLAAVPEFAIVVGSPADQFKTQFAQPASPSEDDKKAGLKAMFSALMKADDQLVAEQVARLVARLEGETGENFKEERELVLLLNKEFPGDVGIFCTYALNIVHLQPGEAVFLKANEPHAYLDGGKRQPSESAGLPRTSPLLINNLPPWVDIMECMATSGQSPPDTFVRLAQSLTRARPALQTTSSAPD